MRIVFQLYARLTAACVGPHAAPPEWKHAAYNVDYAIYWLTQRLVGLEAVTATRKLFCS